MSRLSCAAPALVRGAYGALLVGAPGSLIRLAGGSAGNPRARGVARLLGARHLTQAALVAVRPSPALLALGAEVDLLHSASMLALGGVAAASRRIALTDSVLAALFAADGIAASRRAVAGGTAGQGAPGGFTQRRNAAADRLALVAVPPVVRPRLTGLAGAAARTRARTSAGQRRRPAARPRSGARLGCRQV